VAGGSGGPFILTGTAQVLLGLLAEGLPVQEAVDHPRIHDQWQPDLVLYEPGVAEAVRADLSRRGDLLKEDPLLGVIDAVELAPGASRAVAAVDHRKDPGR